MCNNIFCPVFLEKMRFKDRSLLQFTKESELSWVSKLCTAVVCTPKVFSGVVWSGLLLLQTGLGRK